MKKMTQDVIWGLFRCDKMKYKNETDCPNFAVLLRVMGVKQEEII